MNLGAADPRLRDALREKFEPAMARLNETANRYKSPGKATLALIGFAIGGEVLSSVMVRPLSDDESRVWMKPLFSVGFVFLGVLYFIHVHCMHNPRVDSDMRAACEEVSRLINPVHCTFQQIREGKALKKWVQFDLGGAFSAAMPAMPTAQTLAVTVPPGIAPGTTIAVAMPGGGQVMAQVPAGAVPGTVFHVQAPLAAASTGLAATTVAASTQPPVGNAAPAPAYQPASSPAPAPAPTNEFLQYAQQGAGTSSSTSGSDPYSLGSPLELANADKQKHTA